MGIFYLRPVNLVDDDPLIRHAIDTIYSTYGDTVSVGAKKKPLNKFGQKTSIGTAWTTVAQWQGSVINETFVSTNLIDSISSSDQSNDVGITVTIEGHTIDGSGNLTFVIQDATLDGTDARTKVTLSTPLARATRAYIGNSGTFDSPQAVPTGTIYIYDDTGGVAAGVPSNDSQTKLILAAGFTQTEKTATAISQSDYWIVTGFNAGVGEGTSNAGQVTIRMEILDIFNGGVWRPLGSDIVAIVGQANPSPPPLKPYRIVPKNHDWRIRAITDSSTAPVYAEAEGFLAAVQ